MALTAVTIAAYTGYVLVSLPDVRSLETSNPKATALMEQRAAESGKKYRRNQVWVPYRSISLHLRNAVLVAEDSAFFQHRGYDIEQIRESMKRNWREGRVVRGASTITQQLAKNLYLSTSRNPLRKIRELLIAWQLEEHLTKQRIFEIYLNVIEWGDGIYGAEAAARTYFGKPAAALLPEEAAILAAMIPNPRRYTPHTRLKYLNGRKELLLERLWKWQYLSESDYDAARRRTIEIRPLD